MIIRRYVQSIPEFAPALAFKVREIICKKAADLNKGRRLPLVNLQDPDDRYTGYGDSPFYWLTLSDVKAAYHHVGWVKQQYDDLPKKKVDDSPLGMLQKHVGKPRSSPKKKVPNEAARRVSQLHPPETDR